MKTKGFRITANLSSPTPNIDTIYLETWLRIFTPKFMRSFYNNYMRQVDGVQIICDSVVSRRSL